MESILETLNRKTLALVGDITNYDEEGVTADSSVENDKLVILQETFEKSYNYTATCRPDPAFPEMDLIAAYAGLAIMFIMALYARLVLVMFGGSFLVC